MSYLPEPQEFELPPAGTHLANCYRLIDLGTQPGSQYGPLHKIMLGWELPDEQMKDGRPFTVSGWYTWSMGEKANLRKLLEGWRGTPFGENDFRGERRFNVKDIIGKPCLLTIVHEHKGEKTYANVSHASKLMKGQKAPPLINKPVYVWLLRDLFDPDAFDSLPDGLKTKIMQSPEYKTIIGANPTNGHASENPADGMNDEIPF